MSAEAKAVGRPAKKEMTPEQYRAHIQKVLGGRIVAAKNRLALVKQCGSQVSDLTPEQRSALAKKIGNELVDDVKEIVAAITEGKRAPKPTFNVFD